MRKRTTDIANDVPDEDLEYIERLLFYEFNQALEKKSNGFDVNDEIMRLERAMDSISLIREELDEHREARISNTADHLDDILDDAQPS